MKKLFTICLISASLIANAQEAKSGDNSGDKKDQIKINLSALALTNISLQYEHVLNEHSSLCFGASILPSRGLPTAITDKSTNGDLTKLAVSGFSFTPEYRHYFSGKAPKGFYIAPYFRYSKYTIDQIGFDYDSDLGGKKITYVDGTLNSATLGVLFGSQWTLGSRWTLDWWILGFGFGSQKAKIEGTGTFSNSEVQDMKDGIADLDADFPGTLKSTITNNSISVEYSLGAVAVRGMGLCLGYRF
jgi:hypothetical protein